MRDAVPCLGHVAAVGQPCIAAKSSCASQHFLVNCTTLATNSYRSILPTAVLTHDFGSPLVSLYRAVESIKHITTEDTEDQSCPSVGVYVSAHTH